MAAAARISQVRHYPEAYEFPGRITTATAGSGPGSMGKPGHAAGHRARSASCRGGIPARTGRSGGGRRGVGRARAGPSRPRAGPLASPPRRLGKVMFVLAIPRGRHVFIRLPTAVSWGPGPARYRQRGEIGWGRQPFPPRVRLSVGGALSDLACLESSGLYFCPFVNRVEGTAPCRDPDGSADRRHC